MLVSHVQLFVTPWTVAHHTPLSMGFPSQEYWSGFPFPSPVGMWSTRENFDYCIYQNKIVKLNLVTVFQNFKCQPNSFKKQLYAPMADSC